MSDNSSEESKPASRSRNNRNHHHQINIQKYTDTAEKSKKILKACRHFSYNLIKNALEMNWEDHDLANLIKLIANQLDLDNSKLIKLLEKTETGTPSILSNVLDSSSYNFTPAQLVSVILSTAKNLTHFINLMGESLEYDMFNLSNADTIDMLYSFTENNMDQRESQRYARTICENADSKKVCGCILNKFTYSYTVEVASIFIHDIITLDFFQDLKGSMKEFLIELPLSLKEPVNALLSESHRRDNEGEIIESDQDSQGNLKDFIVADDDDEEEEDISSNNNSNKYDDEEDDDVELQSDNNDNIIKQQYNWSLLNKKRKTYSSSSNSKKIIVNTKNIHITNNLNEQSDNESCLSSSISYNNQANKKQKSLELIVNKNKSNKTDNVMNLINKMNVNKHHKVRTKIIIDNDDNNDSKRNNIITNNSNNNKHNNSTNNDNINNKFNKLYHNEELIVIDGDY